MNQFQRYHQARKTGIDPAKVAVAKPEKYNLVETRTNTILITGKYSLCTWKKNQHKLDNPYSTYRIEPV